jgi:hypothetical protein
MKRDYQRRLLLTVAAAAFAIAPCRAGSEVELVPVIGVRNGLDLSSSMSGVGSVSAGAAAAIGFGVNVRVRPDGWFESFLDHQSLSFAEGGARRA